MRNLIAYLILALFAASTGAQTRPSRDSGSSHPYFTPIRITQLKGCAYLHDSVQMTAGQAATVIPDRFAALLAAMKDAGVMPSGGAIFVYPLVNPARAFTLDLGFPVEDDTPVVGGYQISRLESVLAATAIYMGPPAKMNIGRLYGEIRASGHVPSNMLRIHTLYREDSDSSNNIVLIEIPLQK
jgi:hypothetical protein